MKLLLLSNSKRQNEPYLKWAESFIQSFLGHQKRSLLFIPYAGVTIKWDDYFHNVNLFFQSLGHSLTSIHQAEDSAASIRAADGIIVGGGNSFHLIDWLQKFELLPVISDVVKNGVPYIGWSAGSNVAAPTISTTNDMPIVCPKSFEALNLIPFQINPHFTDRLPPGHGGETRSDRLNEYLAVNREKIVVGLPENSGLRIENNRVDLVGDQPVKIFKYGKQTIAARPDDISNLLQ